MQEELSTSDYSLVIYLGNSKVFSSIELRNTTNVVMGCGTYCGFLSGLEGSIELSCCIVAFLASLRDQGLETSLTGAGQCLACSRHYAVLHAQAIERQ